MYVYVPPPGIGEVGLKVEVKAPRAVYPKLRDEPWVARSGEVHKLTGAEARICGSSGLHSENLAPITEKVEIEPACVGGTNISKRRNS
jgi:hypothetical protein